MLLVFSNGDAFAKRQFIGFDDEHFRMSVDVFHGQLRCVEPRARRYVDAIVLKHLGSDFAPFGMISRVFFTADDSEAGAFKLVNDSCNKRRFRADESHVDICRFSKLPQTLQVIFFDVNELPPRLHSGVSRSDIHGCALAGCSFRDSSFPAAFSNHQYLHLLPPFAISKSDEIEYHIFARQKNPFGGLSCLAANESFKLSCVGWSSFWLFSFLQPCVSLPFCKASFAEARTPRFFGDTLPQSKLFLFDNIVRRYLRLAEETQYLFPDQTSKGKN